MVKEATLCVRCLFSFKASNSIFKLIKKLINVFKTTVLCLYFKISSRDSLLFVTRLGVMRFHIIVP